MTSILLSLLFVSPFVLFIYFIIKRLGTDQVKKAPPKSLPSKYYIDEFGYYRFSNSGKLVHRYIASKKLGRRLKGSEVVHHKDRNKLNNSPENLYVCSRQEHDVIHRHNFSQYGYW